MPEYSLPPCGTFGDPIDIPGVIPDLLIPGYDFETGCSSIDGRPLIKRMNTSTGEIVLLENDAVTAVADGSTLIQCENFEIDAELLCSNIDGRPLWARINKATGVTTITEIDGSAVIDGSTAVSCSGGYDYEKVCASTDGRPLWAKVNTTNGVIELVEIDGSALIDGATAINCTPPNGETLDYTGTFGTGVYTRADLLALTGASDLLSIWFEVRKGGASVDQTGSVTDLGATEVWAKEQIPGWSVGDFTITVAADSTIKLEYRGAP